MAFIDYYKILGVAKDIPQKDVKKAYLKRAKQFHPDLHPDDPKAKAKFQALNEAYDVIGDPEKRRKYDQYGEQWREADAFQGGFKRGGQGGSPFDGFDFSGFSAANIERDGQKITIVLPDPKVVLTSSKVNQHEIRSYVGLVRAGFSDAELSRYEQQGREAIIQSIPSLGITDRARADAARVLVPLLSQLGFRDTDITIAYRKDFKPYDIRRYLEVKGDR